MIGVFLGHSCFLVSLKLDGVKIIAYNLYTVKSSTWQAPMKDVSVREIAFAKLRQDEKRFARLNEDTN
jgi:hypothetical protein